MTAQAMVEEFLTQNGWSLQANLESQLSREVVALRGALILEELAETIKAMRAGDVVETADGLADLKYVVLGTASVANITLADDYCEPASSLTTVPDHWYVFNFQNTALKIVSVAMELLRVSTYTYVVPRATDAAADELRALNRLISNTAADLGLPLKEIFEEVHRSNMSKTPAHAAPGEKYGPGGGKGPDYKAPDIQGILAALERL